MSDHLIPRRDLSFILYDVLDVEGLTHTQRYGAHDRTVFESVLDTAEAIARDHFVPHAAAIDENEPKFENGTAHLIPEVKEALDVYVDAGMMGATFDEERGGLQLPVAIGQACQALLSSANISTTAYPFLTIGAGNMLAAYGSDWQKTVFLDPMVQGRFFGTMCLSEPQAGSSLSDITTSAEPNDKGHYNIVGTKMWISGGAHELSENIVHLVLAKIPGGPPGVKGISLFAVPKVRINEDGSLGASNNVTLVGLNHKMGYRGTVNTVLSFGEGEGTYGYLIGEPNKGLSYMFHMMNEARIGVGLGAAALGYAGYRASLDYAKGRPQGRHPDVKDPESKQVPIIEHADVKRLLLSQKAAVEAALCLVLYCAKLVDEQKTATDDTERQRLTLLLDILTPVAKSWPSEFCLEANKNAIQVLGGYGYTRDYPVERFYRDNRLNPIHEGTHGIQALDLLGRKAVMNDKAAFVVLEAEIKESIDAAKELPDLAGFATDLSFALDALSSTTDFLVDQRAHNQRLALADATLYLDTFGHVVMGWMWLLQALVIQHKNLSSRDSGDEYYAGKLAACRFFFRREMPKVLTQIHLLKKLDDTAISMPVEAF